MAYTVQFSNKSVVVQPGTLDNSTYLTFVGRYVSNYGNVIAQDLALLLENFASDSEPDHDKSVTGQLWFDNTSKALNVFTGTEYKKLGFDVTADAVATTLGETIEDNQDPPQTHNVLSSYIGTVRYSILSPDQEFTPAVAITGFTTIKPGLNIANDVLLPNGGVTSRTNDSELLGGLPSSSYMRTDADTSTSGHVRIDGSDGLFFGQLGLSQVNHDGVDFNFKNNQPDGSIRFYTHDAMNNIHNPMNLLPDGTVQFIGNVGITSSNFDEIQAANVTASDGTFVTLNVLQQSNMGDVGNVSILGGLSNQVLTTDGAGKLSWTEKMGNNVFPFGDLGTAAPDYNILGTEINSSYIFDCSTSPQVGVQQIDLGTLS